jgi:L-iditol 2-dehydrogenase
MKKSVLTGINKIAIIDAPVPEIRNGSDVLIRMVVVGVCGSDIHYYKTGRIGSQVVEYPFTVGHEGAGIVEAVGKNVKLVKPGDRVAIEPAVSCGECDQCKAGRPHTCRNLLFLGCPGQIEGNLAEFIVMPEKQCLKLKSNQSIDDGAISEPLAIGLYAVKQASLSGNETMGILGFGPIGMSVFQMAQARGSEKIFVSEKIDERGTMAAELGARWVGNPLKEDIAESISEKEPMLLDVVFECCGKQDAMDTALEILKPGGKLMVVGIPEFDRWSFMADVARRKEISIIHIRRQNNCAEETLEMLSDGQIDGSAMITHRFGFEDIDKAFDLVANYRDGVMKAMIDF